MLLRLALLLTTLLLATVAGNPMKSSQPLQLISIISLEEPCVRQGGICRRIEDCEGSLAQVHGLCPLQSHQGVECCYME